MLRSCWKGPLRSTATTPWCRSLCRWWRPCAPASTRPRDKWRSWRFWRNGSLISRAGRWASTELCTLCLNGLILSNTFDLNGRIDLALRRHTRVAGFLLPLTRGRVFPSRQSSKSWLIESHLALCQRFNKNSVCRDFCSLLSFLVLWEQWLEFTKGEFSLPGRVCCLMLKPSCFRVTGQIVIRWTCNSWSAGFFPLDFAFLGCLNKGPVKTRRGWKEKTVVVIVRKEAGMLM